ncbi:MAG: replication factor C small subunit [Homavirus sp.]|uniref:Replication factor C small subunit n=1 Tax=Homavirus sp. TaxID=2487769 RepID=A0A3G5A6L9_9VIRU|nr:MAG: replication factor C small subunit [Homavirus sp.]
MIKFNELLEMNDRHTNIKTEVISTKKIIDKTPWVDKYRPKKLDEIVYQDEVVKMLKNTMITGDLPHLLFYGPPGTGKTSTILAIANELFGPHKMRERVIELNASDERGINVVRNKIVTFAKTAIGTPDKRYPSPNYKIIILDEADAMTTEAQSALRKTMEDNSNITRFCFICNYINQIIEPINSRCVKFRFKPLDEKSVATKLIKIAEYEAMNLDVCAIDAITEISDGDMRKSIMILQNLKYVNFKNNKITKDDIYLIAGCVSQSVINKIINICIQDKTKDVRDIVELTKEIRTFGYPIQNIIEQINVMIIGNDNLNDKQKSQICLHFAITEKRLIDGADEYLQLLSILMCIKSAVLNIDSIHNTKFI